MTSQNQEKDQAYECPACKDSGWIDVKIDGIPYAKKCECVEKKRMERFLEESGIAEAFKGVTFDSFVAWDDRVAEAKAMAMQYVEEFRGIERTRKNSMSLLGQVGAGKTKLGVCVLNALMSQGVAVRYVPYREMVMMLKSNVLDSFEYEKALERFTKPRVLFVDDLYKGMTDADRKYVYDVINARYLAMLPTIVTSELLAGELMRVDTAIGSRIIEMSSEYLYELRGNDLNYRLRGLV